MMVIDTETQDHNYVFDKTVRMLTYSLAPFKVSSWDNRKINNVITIKF